MSVCGDCMTENPKVFVVQDDLWRWLFMVRISLSVVCGEKVRTALQDRRLKRVPANTCEKKGRRGPPFLKLLQYRAKFSFNSMWGNTHSNWMACISIGMRLSLRVAGTILVGLGLGAITGLLRRIAP